MHFPRAFIQNWMPHSSLEFEPNLPSSLFLLISAIPPAHIQTLITLQLTWTIFHYIKGWLLGICIWKEYIFLHIINSKWKYVGRPNLIENLSDIKLFDKKALSFSLKFATRICKGDTIKNHKQNKPEFTKGFIQVIYIYFSLLRIFSLSLSLIFFVHIIIESKLICVNKKKVNLFSSQSNQPLFHLNW